MRELKIVAMVLVAAMMLARIGTLIEHQFNTYYQSKTERDFATEVEKAKRTHAKVERDSRDQSFGMGEAVSVGANSTKGKPEADSVNSRQ